MKRNYIFGLTAALVKLACSELSIPHRQSSVAYNDDEIRGRSCYRLRRVLRTDEKRDERATIGISEGPDGAGLHSPDFRLYRTGRGRRQRPDHGLYRVRLHGRL